MVRKNMFYLFVVLISLLSQDLVATENGEPNIYEIEKNSTIKRPDSTSKYEQGKWDIPVVRPLLGLIGQAGNTLLTPIKLGLNGVASVVKTIIPECTGLDTNHSFFSGALEDFKAKVQLISPGTKWCGPGNVAKDYDDIGVLADSDKCCREHDFCPTSIAAGNTDFGLKNGGLFTRSLCGCDGKFYNCLKKANTSESLALGNTYFNVLGPQCFELVNCTDPKVKCRKRQKNGTEYEWSDNPQF